MSERFSSRRHPACLPGWLPRFACAVLLAGGLCLPAAQAAVISNIAYVNDASNPYLDPNGDPGTLASNGGIPVVITSIPGASPSTLTFYKYSPTGQCGDLRGNTVAASSFPFAGGRYEDAGGTLQPLPSPEILPLPGSGGSSTVLDVSVPVTVCPATVFHAGEPVFITLTDLNRNLDPAVAETILITISSWAGGLAKDVDEVLELRETGPNTGIFAAVVQSTTAAVTRGDGRISVGVDGMVRGHYQDVFYPDDTSSAQALVDPFGVVFDAGSNQPINGALIWVIEPALPGCSAVTAASADAVLDACGASVFQDDGVTGHPARMETGLTVPGNPAVPAGGFRFPLMAPGTYRFVVKIPAGYTVPSALVPVGGSAPGRSIVAGSHLQDFVVLPGPALNIDIPADPSQDDLLLVKTVSTTTASAGDFLQYRLTLTNNSAAPTICTPADCTTITDVLPRGMRYQSGSLHRDGVKLADPVISADGRTLTLRIGALAGNDNVVISYVVAVSADAVKGDAVNTARAVGSTGNVNGTLVSNLAQVAVKIEDVLMSGRFTIIGRVFESDCSASFADLKGLANVRIMLEDGTYVVTDKDGQYHIEGVKPGTHVVQMDTASLPKGAEPVSCLQNTRFAGSAYSQFVDVKGGGLWRADFHVRVPPPAAPPPEPQKPAIPDGEAGIRLQTLDNVQVSDLTQELEARNYTFKGRFDPSKDVLLPASVKDLERLLAQLKKSHVQRLEIIGHTDSVALKGEGEKKFGDNYGLSRARAKTIADYLASRLNLSPEQVVLDGKGPDAPMASNDTVAGRAQNRRVDVIAYGGQSSAKVGERSRRLHRLVVDSGLVPAFNLRTMVMLPPDLSYVKGSATLDGAPLADPEDMGGTLVWRIAAAAPEDVGWDDIADQTAADAPAAAEAKKDPAAWSRVITFNTDVVRKLVTTKPAQAREFTFRGSFEPAQAELMAESVTELDQLLEQLRATGSIDHLEIIGHTDNQQLSVRARKVFPDNKALSLARAQTIADSLTAGLGLTPEQVQVQGQGPDQPVASNKLPAGRAQNRRVEVKVFARDAAVSRLQQLCADGYVSLKAVAMVDTPAASNIRLPAVENRLKCTVPADKKPASAGPAPRSASVAALAPAPAEPLAVEPAAKPAVVDTGEILLDDIAADDAEPVAAADTAASEAAVKAAVAAAAANRAAADAAEAAKAAEAGSNDSGRQSLALKAAEPKPEAPAVEPVKTELVSKADDAGANSAGGDINWLARTTGKTGFLFPEEGHNPRAPALRVVVESELKQEVELRVNGAAVSPLNFDGMRKDVRHNTNVSMWRGLPLKEGPNRIIARVRNADGSVAEELVRVVYYSNTPARAVLVPEQSKLVADGLTRPVLAVRMLDRYGQPVRDGVSGPLLIHAPHMSWQQQEETQKRQLAGLDRFQPQFVVRGDEGIALIELAPTTESGTAQIDFAFQSDIDTTRTQELKAWLEPEAREWVMVGFAEGTVGYNTLKDNTQALQDQGTEDGAYSDGKVSFYAKGRVLGKWLLTMAYDTSKQRDRQSLLSTIDPDEYYTLYGDGTEQRYDAASQSKLYLKLERGQFYALFGDYDTGLNDTQLSRYNRTLNGFKTEKAGSMVVFTAYAAETEQNYARDEIQGNGTSGLYRLTQRNIVLNSEQIRIETRDRLRSEIILKTQSLSRHIDYDIDYSAGTLFFKQPINSRDSSFNPVWIVAEYETVGTAEESLNAGGRVGLNLLEGRLAMGITALRDEGGNGTAQQSNSNLAGADFKYRFAADAEVRLEMASTAGEQAGADRSGGAWLAELEHHGSRYDLLLYTRDQESEFGVSQQNLSEGGQQKTGANAVLRLNREWSLLGELYQQNNNNTDSTRQAAATKLRYENAVGTASVGVQVVNDSTDSGVLAGQDFNSEQLTLEASRWFMKRKLELSTQADVGESDSADYPNRFALNAAYALTDSVRLLAGHELTDGSGLKTSTSRAGVQVVPWKGARVDSTLNQSQMSEYGPRTFAQFGLTQSLLINQRWGMDFSVDSSQSVGTKQATPEINNAVSTSNILGLGTARVTANTEDYLALSAGATYRADIWSWTNRLETRNGDTEDRYGITSNFLRQARDGVAFATGTQAFHTASENGSTGNLASLDLSWAWRPLGTQWSVLDRLEFKYEDAESTLASPVFGFDGLSASEARSRRIINNLSLNRVSREWTTQDRSGNLFRRYERNQWSLYYGAKYALDTFDGIDYSGYTDMFAVEVRHDVKTWMDIGLQASTLNSWSTGTRSYSFGPQIGMAPVKNGWVTLGWNVRGFTDRDFDAARYSAQGPYLQLRFKFDQNTKLNRDMVAAYSDSDSSNSNSGAEPMTTRAAQP